MQPELDEDVLVGGAADEQDAEAVKELLAARLSLRPGGGGGEPTGAGENQSGQNPVQDAPDAFRTL